MSFTIVRQDIKRVKADAILNVFEIQEFDQPLLGG